MAGVVKAVVVKAVVGEGSGGESSSGLHDPLLLLIARTGCS